MTIDEGVIKYEGRWTPGPAPDPEAATLLDHWRQPLFAAGLIGEYADLRIGYGNISMRHGDTRQFLISGTQTGRLARTLAQHYTLVTDYDIAANTVHCSGPMQASSEAMTHAAIYQLHESINAVVHVHSRPLWDALRGKLPTTDSHVPYGTPEMAAEFARLYSETSFAENGVAVMAGHDEGILSFGSTLEEAANRVLNLDLR